MKDYLGHELREGDHVVTIVNINRGSGGTAFVTATIDCLTRTRPSLSEFSTVCCDPHSQRHWHSQ